MKKKGIIISVCILLAVCLLLCAVFCLSKNPMGLPRDMINALVEYLEKSRWQYDMEYYTAEERIDQVKNGAQPLHVAFEIGRASCRERVL